MRDKVWASKSLSLFKMTKRKKKRGAAASDLERVHEE